LSVWNGACTDVDAGSFGADGTDSSVASGATQQVACPDGSFNTDGNGACTDVDDGSFGTDGTDSSVATGATQQVVCPDVGKGYFGSTDGRAHATTGAPQKVVSRRHTNRAFLGRILKS
jgi:hypothetical protein